MIRIDCPFCGLRDHSEFTYGKDASITYPELDASMEDWVKAVFERENMDGVVLETWHHNNGCRMWLVVERDTITHEIHSVRAAHPAWAKLLSGEAQQKGRAAAQDGGQKVRKDPAQGKSKGIRKTRKNE